MNTCGTSFFCSVMVIGLLCCAGCISSQAPNTPSTTTLQEEPAATPAAGIPLVTPTAAPVLTTNGQTIPTATTAPPVTQAPVTTQTWIPKSYGRDATDNPQILLLTFVKEYFIFDIPDCAMREVFPQAAGDPAYGIRQPVPKLVMIPDDEMSDFLRAHAGEYANDANPHLHVDPNTIGSPACAGVIANPKWNFVRINATLMPRNARPGEYDIGINVRSRGVIIEQLRLNATFEIDRPVVIARYVPLRLDETDAFDSIELVYARRE